MLGEDSTAERINLDLPFALQTRTLQSKIDATYTRETGTEGHFFCLLNSPALGQFKKWLMPSLV
jgi:hypothetical protein